MDVSYSENRSNEGHWGINWLTASATTECVGPLVPCSL